MTELIEAKEPCVNCGQVFFREKKRGRPPTRCADCRVKYQAQVLEEKINKSGKIDNRPPQLNIDVKLWEGKDLVTTRQDLPIGRQAQCPLCWRIFTSDSACEIHKSYREPVTSKCKPPATIGLVALDKGGYPVWTTKSDIQENKEEQENKS